MTDVNTLHTAGSTFCTPGTFVGLGDSFIIAGGLFRIKVHWLEVCSMYSAPCLAVASTFPQPFVSNTKMLLILH